MDIPKDKNYPVAAGQCNECGGHGCPVCSDRGWLPPGKPEDERNMRRCYRDACGAIIPPSQVAVYCSNQCAMADA